MTPCRYLRWKSATRTEGDRAAMLASLQRQAVPMSCLRTCETWGPDDEPVTVGACCDPERACYQPL